MSIGTGIGKQVRIKKESAWGVAPGDTGAQLLRRTQSTLNLAKNTYQSQEIRSDYQIADFRHGTRRVEGNLNGELSGGTYQMLFEAMFRKAATAVTNITGAELTVAASGLGYTIDRTAGSFITDGLRPGMVAHATAGLDSDSLNVNFLIGSVVSATQIFVYPLNGGTLVEESSVSGCTLVVPGKGLFVPSTGHTDDSFYIEEWHGDLGNLSRQYAGCKVNTCSLKLPATGMATAEFAMLGKNMIVDTSAYYTSPSAETTSGVEAAVNGIVLVGGTPIAIATGLNIDVNGGFTTGEVIGSNTTPAIFAGRFNATGQLTAYLQDETLLNDFLNESEIVIMAAMTETNALNSNFVSVCLPRVKLGGATVDDGEKGLVITAPFQALKKPVTTGFESTTMQMYDSLFV